MDHSVDQQLGKIGSLVSVNRDAPWVGIGPIWGEFVAASQHTNQ